MADEYVKLVKIGLDQSIINASIANADKLTAEIKALTAAQKESGVQDAETTSKIKALTLERNKNLEVVKQANILTNAAIDSNEELRAQLSLLTAQYNKLSKEERETTEAGIKMGKTIKGISDELKENEKAIGDNRRNVGNYTESIKEALVEIGGAVPGLGKFKTGLDNLSTGFKAAGGGVKGLGAALMTLGLPLIIAGVTALVGVLKTFKPIADAVESSVVALKAAFGALISGGSITEAVKQSQALLTVMRDLEDTQKAFAISAQKYNNEIAKLIVSSKDRTKTDEERLAIVAKANKLEEEYFNASAARINKELSAREGEFMRKNDITNAELQLLAEGTSKQALALRERLEKGAEYSEDELAQVQDLLTERAKLEGESLVLKEKLANRTNQLEEEMAKERQAMADKVKAATDKVNEERQKELEKKQAIAAKEFEDAKKQAEAMAKIAEEFSRSRMSDYARQLLEIDERAAQLKKAGVDEIEITKWKEEELDKMGEAAKQRQMAKDAEAFTRKIALLDGQEQLDIQSAELSISNETELQNRKYQIDLDFATKRLALMREEAMLDGVLTEEEIQNLKKVENTIKGIQQTLANPDAPTVAQALGMSEGDFEAMQIGLQVAQQAISAVSDIVSADSENRINQIDRRSESEIAAVKKGTESEKVKSEKIAEIEKKAAMEKYKIDLQNFKISKGLQITNAIIGTAQAAIAAYSSGAAVPVAGIALGPAMAAIAAAFGAVQIGVIAAKQPPSPPAFATGGKVRGAGTGTSDSIPARLSNGEAVINARSTAMFEPILSQMNKAGGGVDWYRGEGFSNGGIVKKFAAGGIAVSSSALMRENEQAATLQQTFLQSQPVLVIEEFQSVQGRQVRTEQNLSI
jgi:hypothetical protein